MLSVHTSPLDQPGTGDAGGLNVYVAETARRLAAAGVEVDVFTRATSSRQPPSAPLAPGVAVRHLPAGPYEGLRKEDLPGQLCALAAGVLRAEAARPAGWYDLVHSHYWLSGQVGALAAERWDVPLVHSMHTLGRVKNAALAAGDAPEPLGRIVGEQQTVDAADRLLANTADEAAALVDLYGADPARVAVVHPGVDLDVFTPRAPGDGAGAPGVPGAPAGPCAPARARLGLPADALVLLFVGRVQPLKAPDVLVRAAAELVAADPALRRRLVVVVCGGPSGSGLERPAALADLAAELGVGDLVRLEPPVGRERLADWYRAADLVCVPSHSESFGLVAVEAAACGTPVVAAAVGGLRTAVADGTGGVLVDGHDPRRWAGVLADLLADPARRAALSAGAVRHAAGFGWDATARATLDLYAEVLAERAAGRLAAVGGVV